MGPVLSAVFKDALYGTCSNTVHVANGYNQDVQVFCHSHDTNLKSKAVVSSGEFTKHDTKGWTDTNIVQVTAIIPGINKSPDESVSMNVKSNRSVIVTANGRLKRAKYTIGPFGGSSIWTDEFGKNHFPATNAPAASPKKKKQTGKKKSQPHATRSLPADKPVLQSGIHFLFFLVSMPTLPIHAMLHSRRLVAIILFAVIAVLAVLLWYHPWIVWEVLTAVGRL